MSRDIEDIFKEKFADYESAPSADLFGKIQTELNRTKKRIYIWYAAVSAILLIVGSMVYVGTKTETEVLTETKTTETSPKENTFENVLENDAPITLQTETKEAIENPINRKLSPTTNLPKQNSEKNDEVKSNSSEIKSVVQTDLANRFNEILAEKGIKDPEKATVYTKDKMYDVGQRPKEAITLKVIDNEENKSENNAPKEKEVNTEIIKNTIATTKPDTANSITTKPDDNDLPSNAHKLNNWTIQLSGGPSIATRILTGEDRIVALRNETENPALSYNIQVDAIYAINQKWNLGIGINYIRRNEVFDYSRTNTYKIQHISFDTFTVYQNPLPPRQLIVSDTSYEFNSTTTNFNSSNTYRTIQLPISIERVFSTKTPWNFYTKASANAVLWQNAEGLVVDGESEEVRELNSIPKNKIGLNAVGFGMGVGYSFVPQFQVIVYPTANYQFANTFNQNYAVRQNELSLHSSLGLRYKF